MQTQALKQMPAVNLLGVYLQKAEHETTSSVYEECGEAGVGESMVALRVQRTATNENTIKSNQI